MRTLYVLLEWRKYINIKKKKIKYKYKSLFNTTENSKSQSIRLVKTGIENRNTRAIANRTRFVLPDKTV